ncbi:MAG: twin-arginine translocase TatA/TatE family subunit [Phycisphaerae bacterium]|nr:twin-arginine translocase TatA/TatE family subunit [Gemmatimonadaceae bacterium]
MGLQNFGVTEMLIILVVVLLLFGAKRIPEIAGSMGKGINEFKRNLSDAQKQITSEPPPRANVGSGDATVVNTVKEEERPEPKRLLG